MKRNNKIEQIRKQFLCGTLIKDMKWHSDSLTVEEQQIILAETVNTELMKNYPLKLEYQTHFLKALISRLEQQGADIDDAVFTTFGRLMAPRHSDLSPSRNFKHYCGDKNTITLSESVNLISNGTTGLRTWQAAVVLAEWCTQNGNLLENKKILELGSGIGLTGLVAIVECCPESYIFTDCHPSVLQTLCSNIELNLKNTYSKLVNEGPDETFKIVDQWRVKNDTLIKVVNLPWEETDDKICKSLGKIDMVFATDIVYDESIFEPLFKTMQVLAQHCEVDHYYFCCTERNEDTLGKFLSLVETTFIVSEIDVPNQKTYIWSTETPIRLFDITR